MPRRHALAAALLGSTLLGSTLSACGPGAGAPEADAPAPSVTEGAVTVPAAPGAVAPRLALAPDGTPLLSWTEPSGDGHALRYALWTESGWSPAETADAGDDWFVNWADTPGVVPLGDGQLLAHTLTRHPEGESPYAYDVRVRQRAAGTWAPARLLHDDGVAAEHGFVSAVALDGGRAGLVWLDGRNQGGSDHGHHAGDMTLRYARVAPDGTRSDEAELDARTCDCCPTAAARTDRGLVVAYRDRSPTEIRDIAVVRQVDGAWTEPAIPHADGWEIAGCPVNGPALAAQGQRLALAWFTGAVPARVRLAVSDDGGATWGPAERIDDGAPIGRVDVALLDDGTPVVVWLEGVGDTAEVRVRRAGSASQTVATVEAGRASGVPHVVPLGDRALVAWTAPDADDPIRTAVVAP